MPQSKGKIISHTDDGTPIVNVTLAQIRKGQTTKGLVRIPQVAERSRCYEEAAKVIGEREALALPYHGGRMWKCEVKLSDDAGAFGSNFKSTKSQEDAPKKKGKTPPLPLFRWYRHALQLATLPHILDEIIPVEHKMATKKKWLGLSADDDDSSDEEWEEPEPQTNVFEISALTTAAYEDETHPLPYISRSWISPDLQRFHTRKSAISHAEKLCESDLLIDKILYGYGKNGIRLRPSKPTRKAALEAGMARFLRDGLWIVGQEEMWIEKRREVFNRRVERELGEKNVEKERSEADGEEGTENDEGLDASARATLAEDHNTTEHIPDTYVAGDNTTFVTSASDSEKCGVNNFAAATSEFDKSECETPSCPAVAAAAAISDAEKSDMSEKDFSQSPDKTVPLMATIKSTDPDKSPLKIKVAVKQSTAPVDEEKVSATISPNESDASTNEESTTLKKKSKPKSKCQLSYIEPLPESTHYRLNKKHIEKCYTACIEHYERVMFTVKARSLHHELADGFDVMRERGKGRYDMELPQFDTEEYAFLTDQKKAAWMPIIHKILGEDAILVHKGCFLSLPGSETQVYHQDGVHLNKKFQKPCHAVNVFIPLVDYDMTNGPTEFCLGTHYLGHENFVKEHVYTPCVTAGTPVIFDYRLGHRGLRNYSLHCRPVVYLTYSAVASGKEFRDSVNFSRRRYKKLGDFVEKPLSREERRLKRKRSFDEDEEESKKEAI